MGQGFCAEGQECRQGAQGAGGDGGWDQSEHCFTCRG
jgi:hypothetical protein